MSALLLALLVLGLQDRKPAPADSDPATRGDRLVKAELLADRAAIRPGETFTLATKLTVQPGWHVYWENPGDSGLPTRLKIAAPAGFQVDDPRSPTPGREIAEGDIVTFIHKGEVVFLTEVRAPKEFPKDVAASGRIAFDLEANWLVCQEACFNGSGKAHLEIPLAAASAPQPAAANEKLFSDARARLPKPWSELAGAQVAWSGTVERPVLRISVPNADGFDLFPLTSRTTSVEKLEVEKGQGAATLRVELRYKEISPAEPARVQGLLVAKTGHGEVSFQLNATCDRKLAKESGQ